MEQINLNKVSHFFSQEGKHLYAKLQHTVKSYSMNNHIESGVLVGLSGGADSVMLLCFLVEYRIR